MADITDYSQNVSIHDESNDAAVTTTTSGSKVLLDVNATVSNDESPTKYQLLTDYDVTGTIVTSASDAELFSYTGVGVVSFIAVTCATSASWEIVINTDSTERLRITMGALGNTLGLTGTGGEPIWTQTANKQFRYHPTPELGFKTSFSVEAKATGANVTLTHLVMYKEKVS